MSANGCVPFSGLDVFPFRTFLAAAQKESREEKERREARAILMERRDIEPGCPVPQRSPEIPPDKDY